jgi:hypothetical protein
MGDDNMQKAIEIDFLSEDATIRQNSMRWLKQEQKRESLKLDVDLSKPKAFAATA